MKEIYLKHKFPNSTPGRVKNFRKYWNIWNLNNSKKIVLAQGHECQYIELKESLMRYQMTSNSRWRNFITNWETFFLPYRVFVHFYLFFFNPGVQLKLRSSFSKKELSCCRNGFLTNFDSVNYVAVQLEVLFARFGFTKFVLISVN